jgi:CheY-like chemotaxis protein
LVSAVIPLADGSLALVLSVSELYAGPRAMPIRIEPARSSRRKTVLLVDDSPVVRDLLAEALRAHGLSVIEAGDGEDALQKMETCPPLDLVVTDIDMPKLDGIELLRRLRRPELARRLPVVVVSMRGSSEDQQRALEAGADAYLVKTDLSHAGLWTMLARFLK